MWSPLMLPCLPSPLSSSTAINRTKTTWRPPSSHHPQIDCNTGWAKGGRRGCERKGRMTPKSIFQPDIVWWSSLVGACCWWCSISPPRTKLCRYPEFITTTGMAWYDVEWGRYGWAAAAAVAGDGTEKWWEYEEVEEGRRLRWGKTSNFGAAAIWVVPWAGKEMERGLFA